MNKCFRYSAQVMRRALCDLRGAAWLAVLIVPLISANAAGVPARVAAAVADPGRPAADTERDAGRKPAETLAFVGVKSGAAVAELLPGGGYYTRILSRVVGDAGHVYAIVPPRPVDAPADRPDFAARIKAVAAEPEYANVSVIVAPLSQFELPAPVDLVWTSLNYHDLHNIPDFDMAAFNKQVFHALKPGGIYLVLDHAAASGTGVRDTASLHRIDREVVKREVTAAGFVLVAGSDLLRRADDPHTQKVTDAPIRGKTDVFILKFRKPRHGMAAQP
jgi:predicted methyltransferase